MGKGKNFKESFGYLFRELSYDIQTCAVENSKNDGLTSGILLFNSYGYYYYHICLDKLDPIETPESVKPSYIINDYLTRRDIKFKISHKTIKHLGRFFCSTYGRDAIEKIFFGHEEIIKANFSLYGLTYQEGIKSLKESWLAWIDKHLSTFENIENNIADKLIAQLLYFANFLGTLTPIYVPSTQDLRTEDGVYSPKARSNIADLHYAVKKTRLNPISEKEFRRKGQWLYNLKNPITQLIEYCIISPQAVKIKEKELDHFLDSGYSEGTVTQFFEKATKLNLDIFHYPITYLNQYQGLAYLVKPSTSEVAAFSDKQGQKEIDSVLSLIREWNFPSMLYEQKYLLAKDVFAKSRTNTPLKEVSLTSPFLSSAYMTMTYRKEEKEPSGFYNYRTANKKTAGNIPSGLQGKIQKDIFRKFMEAPLSSPPYVWYLSEGDEYFSKIHSLKDVLVVDKDAQTSYIIVMQFPDIGGLMILFYDDDFKGIINVSSKEELEFFEEERKKTRILNNYGLLRVKIQNLIRQDNEVLQMLNGKKIKYESIIHTTRDEINKYKKNFGFAIGELVNLTYKDLKKSRNIPQHLKDTPIKVADGAIEAIIRLDITEKTVLRRCIEEALDTAIELSKSSKEQIVISPELIVDPRVSKTERNIHSDREVRAIEILDRYELAAKKLMDEKQKINNRTIGEYYNMSSQSISESIKQYKIEIQDLLELYTFRWNLLKANLSPVKKISYRLMVEGERMPQNVTLL